MYTNGEIKIVVAVSLLSDCDYMDSDTINGGRARKKVPGCAEGGEVGKRQ